METATLFPGVPELPPTSSSWCRVLWAVSPIHREGKWKRQRHTCHRKWTGIPVQRPGAWLSTGTDVVRPHLLFSLASYLSSSTKDAEHSGPPNPALVNWLQFTSRWIFFLYWHDQKKEGSPRGWTLLWYPQLGLLADCSHIWHQHLSFRDWWPVSSGSSAALKKSKWVYLTGTGTPYEWIVCFRADICGTFFPVNLPPTFCAFEGLMAKQDLLNTYHVLTQCVKP